MAWRSRKDVHSGTLCRDTTRGDGGWAEPPGGGEALWRSPQYDHEDAPVFGPAGLSAARAARVEEAWPVYGVDRQGPGSRPKRPQEAASHGAPDIRAGGGQNCKGWTTPSLAHVRGTAKPLPVRRPLWAPRKGQRQGQGGGAGRVCPPQLHDAVAGRR